MFSAEASYIRVSEYLFSFEIKKYSFLHKATEKAHLNLHFKFDHFFSQDNRDMKILSLVAFPFPNINDV